jgi:hypothetical protein
MKDRLAIRPEKDQEQQDGDQDEESADLGTALAAVELDIFFWGSARGWHGMRAVKRSRSCAGHLRRCPAFP